MFSFWKFFVFFSPKKNQVRKSKRKTLIQFNLICSYQSLFTIQQDNEQKKQKSIRTLSSDLSYTMSQTVSAAQIRKHIFFLPICQSDFDDKFQIKILFQIQIKLFHFFLRFFLKWNSVNFFAFHSKFKRIFHFQAINTCIVQSWWW